MDRPSAGELVRRYGSPLYTYDGDRIRERWRRLRSALPDCVSIHYAVKANPSLALLALLRSLGAGAEIASAGEMLAVERAGFAAEETLFAGPGKTREEVEEAVRSGVLVHAESLQELGRLSELGRARGEPARCGIRVHVPWGADEAHTIIGGGKATKFGIEEEEARRRAGEFSRLEGARIVNLHVFNASNILDADALLGGARRTLSLAADLAAAGVPIETVDIGGGLGVPYAEADGDLDVERFGAGLGDLHGEFRDAFPEGLRLAVEPGRWLVAEAGLYLTRVLDRKKCGGTEFLLVDGGIHHLLRPALIGQAHRVRNMTKEGEPQRRYRIGGPLCTSLDSFGEHTLPETTAGDVLAVECAGAYGLTESMTSFLSHPVPAEVLLLGGQAYLARPRRGAERHLEGQEIPAFLLPDT